MVSKEEKARRKEMAKPAMAGKGKQASLKEDLIKKQTERRMKEMLGIKDKPLAKQEETEKEIAEEKAGGGAGKAVAGAAIAGLAKAAAPEAAGAIGTAKMAGEAGKMAAWVTLFEGIEGFFIAIKDPGFILFLAGLAHYFLLGFLYSYVPWLKVIFSLVFLGYSVLFIFKGRGAIVVVLFLIWYWIFKSAISIPFFALAALVLLAYAWWIKHRTGKIVIEEDIIGLLPILIFYIDLGLLSFLQTQFGLLSNSVFLSLVSFIPWWALLGLFSAEKNSKTKTWIISISRFVAIAYVIILLVGAVPSIGFKKAIPGFGELVKTKEGEGVVQIPGWKLSFYRLSCTMSYPAEPDMINDCVKQKTAETVCAKFKKEGLTHEYEDCYAKETGVGAQGEALKELTATKVQFVRPSELYSETLKKNNTQYPIPYDLILASTVKPIRVTIECKFKTEIKNGTKNISGTISPEQYRDIEVFGPEITRRVSCMPEEPYVTGDYSVTFEATVQGVTTISFLDRIFVDKEITPERKSELLKNNNLKTKEGSKSGQEFAAFYFEIGTDETFIYGGESVIPIIGRVKNLKEREGEIISVEKLEIDLRDPRIYLNVGCPDFTPTSDNRIAWQGYAMPSGQIRVMPDINCQLTLPEEFTNLGLKYQRPEYVIEDFKASMTYNYKIKKEDKFKIVSITATA